jgi:hypothetical protein
MMMENQKKTGKMAWVTPRPAILLEVEKVVLMFQYLVGGRGRGINSPFHFTLRFCFLVLFGHFVLLFVYKYESTIV